jgi:hypothetical protein
MVKTLPLRKVSLTTIVTVVLTVVAMSSTVFSTATTTAPVAFAQHIVNDSEQAVIAAAITTNDADQNDTTTDRHTDSLRLTQSPENGLDAECEGDLKCRIFDNNTLTATTNTGQNTTNNNSMMITGALNALNQSLTQSVNQSSIQLPSFGDNNDFDDMLNNDLGIFNEHEDLDSEMDEWIDRMFNRTLSDPQASLQTSPDLLLPASA